jgi:hypothetical protein
METHKDEYTETPRDDDSEKFKDIQMERPREGEALTQRDMEKNGIMGSLGTERRTDKDTERWRNREMSRGKFRKRKKER